MPTRFQISSRSRCAALALLGLLASAAGGGTPCPGALDLDGSGLVDGGDLGLLLGAWGPCPSGCAADLDGSGAVDGADLGALLSAWNLATNFDYGPAYPDGEALQVALETLGPGGPLLVGAELYDRVDRDMALIRAAEPLLASQLHSPAWSPSSLIVKVLDAADPADYQCLNAFYGVTNEQFLFSSGGGKWYVLSYPGALNVEALALEYAALDAVQFAEPDGLIGGQNFWTPVKGAGGTWTWTVDDGFLDCFDGCDCHAFYTFEVTEAGAVTLVDYVEFGQPWCGFGG